MNKALYITFIAIITLVIAIVLQVTIRGRMSPAVRWLLWFIVITSVGALVIALIFTFTS